MLYAIKFGSWSKRPHSKKPHPKRPQNFLLPKRPQPKWPHCIWSKRPHKKDHYQNGHTVFGQNSHKGGITTETATLHLVKMATQGSLPKRPHCIWSKWPHREDHYQNGHTAFGQNGHTGRITGLDHQQKGHGMQHESLPKWPHYRSLARQQSRTQVCLLACRAHFSNDFSIVIKTGNVEQRCAALPNLQQGCTIAGQRRAAFAARCCNVVGKLLDVWHEVLNVRRLKDEARVLTTLNNVGSHFGNVGQHLVTFGQPNLQQGCTFAGQRRAPVVQRCCNVVSKLLDVIDTGARSRRWPLCPGVLQWLVMLASLLVEQEQEDRKRRKKL